MSHISRFPWVRRLAVIGAGALMLGASLGPAAPASAEGGDGPSYSYFSIAAHAAPMAVEFGDTGAPVIAGEVLYATPAVTGAAFDSVGNSAAYAAGPYPGDALPALGGAFNAVSPTGPVLPPYPFRVASQYPGTPEQTQDTGGRHLASASSDHGSDAEAQVGAANGSPALASTSSRSMVGQDSATDVLTAAADSLVEGFSVGPMLTIGQLASHAEVTGAPGAKPTRRTSLSLGNLIVMGTAVGLTDQGLAPVPGTPKGTDLNDLTGQLSAAGITLRLVGAQETDTGVDSAGLVVGVTRDVPNHGVVTITYLLGRVRARVESKPA